MKFWRKFKAWRRRRKHPGWGRFVYEQWLVQDASAGVGVVKPEGWEFVPLLPRGPKPFNRRGHW